MTIAEQIRQARKDANLTQVDLAKILGTSQRFVSGLERGERRPNIVHLATIARACGCEFRIGGGLLLDQECVG